MAIQLVARVLHMRICEKLLEDNKMVMFLKLRNI